MTKEQINKINEAAMSVLRDDGNIETFSGDNISYFSGKYNIEVEIATDEDTNLQYIAQIISQIPADGDVSFDADQYIEDSME